MEDQKTANEVANISDALDRILTQLGTVPPTAGRSMTATELMELYGDTEHSQNAASLIRDPVGFSLRLGIEALGRRLNELGGQKLMLSVLEDVAARDSSNEEWRTNVMDKRFDGIGTWMA